MEDQMKIEIRRYKDFENTITDTLNEFVVDPDLKQLKMINTGVTVDDDSMVSIVDPINNTTVASIRINPNYQIVSIHWNSQIFGKPNDPMTPYLPVLFWMKDKSLIQQYLNSFIGLTLEM